MKNKRVNMTRLRAELSAGAVAFISEVMNQEMNSNLRTKKLEEHAKQISEKIREATTAPRAISQAFTDIRNAIRDMNMRGHLLGRRMSEYQSELNSGKYPANVVLSYRLDGAFDSLSTRELESVVKDMKSDLSDAIASSENAALYRKMDGLYSALDAVYNAIYPKTFYGLVLTEREKSEKTNASERAKRESTSEDIPIDINKFLSLTESLLHSSSYDELALGIALATGRRMAEVVYVSTMTVPDADGYNLFVEGLTKKKGRTPYAAEENVTIPVLFDPFLIVSALKRLRAMPEIKVVIDEVKANDGNLTVINKRLAMRLSRCAKITLSKLSDERDKSEWKFSDSRNIAKSAVWFFEKPADDKKGTSEIKFANQYLGHDSYDATEHYRGYKFFDGGSLAKKEEVKKESKEEVKFEPGLAFLEKINSAEDAVLQLEMSGEFKEGRILNVHDRLCWYLRNNPETRKISHGMLMKQKKLGGVGASQDVAKAYFNVIKDYLK